MKLKKITGDKLGQAITTAGGGVTGALLSNGVSGAIPLDNKTLTKGIVLALGIAGAASIDGNDGLSRFAQGACVGMSIQQGKELVKETVGASMPDNKFINDSFEKTTVVTAPAMGSQALAASRRRKTRKRGRRSLGSPEQYALPQNYTAQPQASPNYAVS